VEVYADFPTQAMTADAELDRVPVERAFIIQDGARRLLVDQRDTLVVRPGEGRQRPVGYEREFPPGEYAFRLEALEPQTNHGARALGALSIFSFPSERFTVSDVLVGRNVRALKPVPRSRDDVALEVLADMTLDPQERIGLYWESYGAKAAADGQYRLEVEVTFKVVELYRAATLQARFFGGMADALKLSAEGTDVVSVKYPVTAPSIPGDDRLAHQLAVDLTDAPPGEYRLEIRMRDLESGRVDLAERRLFIRRP
jgi:hypothetical protein